MSKAAFLTLFIVLLIQGIQGCIHEKLNITPSFVIDETPKSRILSSSREPIRITTDFTYLTGASSTYLNYIKYKLLPPAISYFKKTLKVIPITGKLIAGSDTLCYVPTPSSYKTQGIVGDLTILVTGEYSDESFLAWATACAQHPTTRRPVVGQINFNYRLLQPDVPGTLEEDILTTIHELFHVLGFSPNLYNQYVDPTTFALKPSPLKTATINGVSRFVLDIEPLTSKLEDYFGCADIEGGLLEDQGSSGSAGAHWERKVFHNEVMTASEIDDARISEFTLALMEATGWYEVDYSMAEPFFWGKGKGCNFIRGKCVETGGTPNFDEFCSPLMEYGCTHSGRSQGFCGTTQIRTGTVSSSMNYWGNNTIVSDSFADNCPYFAAYSNLDCENPAHKKLAELPSAESYGYGSRCFSGSFRETAASSITLTYCFQFQCEEISTNNYKLTVHVGDQSVYCTTAGPVTVPGYFGTLTCPDPNVYCTTVGVKYCKRGCLGNGVCTGSKCICSSGWEGNDCSINTNAPTETNDDEKGFRLMTIVLALVGTAIVVGATLYFGIRYLKRLRAKKAAAKYRGNNNNRPNSSRQGQSRHNMPNISGPNMNIMYQNQSEVNFNNVSYPYQFNAQNIVLIDNRGQYFAPQQLNNQPRRQYNVPNRE